MTIQDLQNIIDDKPDDLTFEEWMEMPVLIPMNASEGFTGEWLSPCLCEAGLASFGVDEDSEEMHDMFILVPHGFFDEPEGIDPELN